MHVHAVAHLNQVAAKVARSQQSAAIDEEGICQHVTFV